MDDKLPGCVGYIDGTHIPLDEAPVEDPESYFTRKQRYAIQLQAVCDNAKRLRNIFVGFPGSVHDARVFANSDLGKRTGDFLSDGEWIGGDSAYPNTHFIVTPFKINASDGTAQQRRQFNRYFSSYRVQIECCFGRLKGLFQSLKSLRIRVDRDTGHKLACDWIRACCVLYNMVLSSFESQDVEFEENETGSEEQNWHGVAENDHQRSLVFEFVVNKLNL